jgi:hypothetical protein
MIQVTHYLITMSREYADDVMRDRLTYKRHFISGRLFLIRVPDSVRPAVYRTMCGWLGVELPNENEMDPNS